MEKKVKFLIDLLAGTECLDYLEVYWRLGLTYEGRPPVNEAVDNSLLELGYTHRELNLELLRKYYWSYSTVLTTNGLVAKDASVRSGGYLSNMFVTLRYSVLVDLLSRSYVFAIDSRECSRNLKTAIGTALEPLTAEDIHTLTVVALQLDQALKIYAWKSVL